MKVLILLLLSFSAFSAELIIKNTNFIKLERQHQFRVEFKDDNGKISDVTRDADFSIESEREVGPGRFIFSLPYFNRGEMIYKLVKVSYQFDSKIYTSSERINIDPTPDYMQINGPFYLQSNGVYQFRAIGYYGGRSIDLTRNGQWMAFRGIAMSSGLYRAPLIRGRARVINDSLVFSFGRGRFTKSLNIRSL